LEDTIHLKNIHLPYHVDPDVDLSYLHDPTLLNKKHKINNLVKTTFASTEDVAAPLRNGEHVDAHARGGNNVTLLLSKFSLIICLRWSLLLSPLNLILSMLN
jgi:hypothetical protein